MRDMVADWAASGAMALTGRARGSPLLPPGVAASVVAQGVAALGLSPMPGLLGERAAYFGFSRNAPRSCGGSFRILRSLDGHVGLSLARPSDVDLVSALVEHQLGLADASDPTGLAWDAVAEWLGRVPTAAAQDRIRLLGLPGGAVPTSPPIDRPGVITTTRSVERRSADSRPLVVDLTSLWAGPLCAHLLGLCGAHVVKVESTQRPDAARFGSPAFFDLLHRGHKRLTLDLRAERDQLKALIESADLVLEASRPRALRQLGVIAEDVVAQGTSWVSITACGRESDAVGFGDDVAASAGLVLEDPESTGELIPVADALADPLAGLAAATAAAAALASGKAQLIDVSMTHVAAETVRASPPHETVRIDNEWWVEYDGGRVRVEKPYPRDQAPR